MEARKYYVKGSWIFNLESMSDHLWCIVYDIEDGKIELPVEIAGKKYYSTEEIMELKDECYELEWIAKCGRVTGREYGRIKALVEYRVMARYARCINSGMSDYKAGECFRDI